MSSTTQQLKAFKFRIYPTAEQESLLQQTFGCVRFVWNQLTENFNNWSPDSIQEKINEKVLKDNPEFSFLKDAPSTALQQKRRDFEELKKQFFNKNRKKKIGRPNFKSKRASRQSFRLTNHVFSLNQENSTIRLLKIGDVKVALDRVIPDNAVYKNATVSYESTGKYFVSILVKINVELKPTTGKMVGIDLGLKDLFIFSDGTTIENPKYFRENQAELKKAQKHLSCKKKGSNRYNRQKRKVARIHEKIKNKRKHLAHTVSSTLVKDYDVICLEDLNVAGMMKNHCLAKSIADAGWSMFKSFLEYKCNWYGKTLVVIDRFFPSSKTCSCCGHKEDKMGLDVRSWTCSSCGTVHDRDVNAARNILVRGFSDLTGIEHIRYDETSFGLPLEAI